ncbi:MAG: membrane protein insertase YidC [Rickettsiales bacterium]|jgi:YidC/Oxa1 family membrane protein insertase|nr:membrane protein insertase YidC [Rickettsiales bacterium]
MKNINPEESRTRNRSFTETLILYVVFFLMAEFGIVRPLMKVLIGKQMEKKEEMEEQQKDRKVVATNGPGENNRTNFNEKSEYVVLENDYLKLTLSTQGLLLNNLVLKKYTDAGENVRLLTPEKSISIGWLSNDENIKIPGENTLWTVENNSVTTGDNVTKVTLFHNSDMSVKFRIVLTLDEKYLLNVEQTVENNSASKILLKPLLLIKKNSEEIKNRNDLFSFNGALGVFDDKIHEIKTKKIRNSSKEFFKPTWAGITDKYGLVAAIGKNPEEEKVNFTGEGKTLEVSYTTKKDLEILGNSTTSIDSKFFMGAKDLEILKEYSKNERIKLLDRSIDFGIFYFLAKPMNDLLNFLYKITKNFGLAIILLTVTVKIIMYPTVKKSFVTMALMKEIQPKIKTLQNSYGSDSTKFREELVKLYKKYDLNPLASIFPVFVQIPIFFSLYKVISVSLNMRQAPFFWFIRDLSAADPSNILNLFGLLPRTITFKIGLLPCLMALTMYLQQKLSSSMDVAEKSGGKNKVSDTVATSSEVTKFMPLIFLFMFASFPSGLLLYWIFNNIITIVQQYYVVNIYIKRHIKFRG